MISILRRITILILLAALLGALAIRQRFISYFDPTHANAPKVLVVWYRGIGEQEITERLQIAGERMGINLRVVSVRPNYWVRWLVPDLLNTAIERLQPDLVLTIQDWLPRIDDIPNYMALTLGTERYLDGTRLINPEHAKFDALLPSFKDIDQLATAVNATGKQYHGFPWYPTAHATDYAPAKPQKLFYAGGFLWDNTRNSDKYQQVFKKLDQTGYFAVCGPKRKWRHTPNSAIGFIPVDGTKLLDTHHKYGISLLLHHKLHLDGGAPTGRIFEAAAANTVIISDKHPFIIKNFGDNVLYIDLEQDAEGIFAQIDKHVQWIMQNPAEAQRMADNCHEIFLAKFTLEQQLTRLLRMHAQLTADSQEYNY